MRPIAGLLILLVATTNPPASATGVKPESTLILISEENGQAQMGVLNTEAVPLLLVVKIIDLPEDPSAPAVFAGPSTSRLEANGHQVVRFMLTKRSATSGIQHMKRVSFEGLPGVNAAEPPRSGLALTIRQEIPMVISPAGLKQDNEPWKLLVARSTKERTIEVSNPSPFVVRLASEVILLPSGVRTTISQRNFILPGEKLQVRYDTLAVPETPRALQLSPASPWGYMVQTYELPLTP